MAFTYTADSSAPPAAVWELLAEPGQWHRWAPHIRGVRGFGGARVTSPSAGVILLAGVVPVLALITEVTATSWTWRVGLVRVRHSVTPHGSGSQIAVELGAPWPVEPVLETLYGPIAYEAICRLGALASGSADR